MTTVTVKINGVEYNLKGDENQEYLHKIAGYVDEMLKDIMENNSRLSVSSASILTAMNLADNLFKSEKSKGELLNKVTKLEENEDNLKEQLQVLKKQLLHLENYNKELQNKLVNLEKEQNKKTNTEELATLKNEYAILQENAKNYLKENTELKSLNKELKFQLQSSKYKIIDLQHRLLDNQIDLVKVKKDRNPLLSDTIK